MFILSKSTCVLLLICLFLYGRRCLEMQEAEPSWSFILHTVGTDCGTFFQPPSMPWMGIITGTEQVNKELHFLYLKNNGKQQKRRIICVSIWDVQPKEGSLCLASARHVMWYNKDAVFFPCENTTITIFSDVSISVFPLIFKFLKKSKKPSSLQDQVKMLS